MLVITAINQPSRGVANRQFSTNEKPGVAKKDIELMSVAIIEKPTTHPGIERPAKKYDSEELCRKEKNTPVPNMTNRLKMITAASQNRISCIFDPYPA